MGNFVYVAPSGTSGGYQASQYGGYQHMPAPVYYSGASSGASSRTSSSGMGNSGFGSKRITVSDVDKVYDAMYCWGTDDEALENVLDKVNKDNVLDLMLGWNKYHSAEKGESFMKAFMWDADSKQKEKYGKLIARALRDKAEELGVFDELANKFAKIDKEMSSTVYINNSICDTYDEIIEKLANKAGLENGKPKDCYDDFVGAMETCKEYGLLGNAVALVGGTIYGVVKGVIDFIL